MELGIKATIGEDGSLEDARVYADRQYPLYGWDLGANFIAGGYSADSTAPPLGVSANLAIVSPELTFSGRGGRWSPTGGSFGYGPGVGFMVTAGEPTSIFSFSIRGALVDAFNSLMAKVPGAGRDCW